MLAAANCGAQSMRDMTVNYPSTYRLSPAISLDQYLQSQLIADIKSEIGRFSALEGLLEGGCAVAMEFI